MNVDCRQDVKRALRDSARERVRVLVAAAALGIVIFCAGAAVVALAVLWLLPGHGVGGERGRLTRFLSLVPDCRWRLVVPVPRSVTHVTVHKVVADVVIAAGHGQARLRRHILLHILLVALLNQ